MALIRCRVCGSTTGRGGVCKNPDCPTHAQPTPGLPLPEGEPETEEPGQEVYVYDPPPVEGVDTLGQALDEGAVLIRRASNGWILESSSGTNGERYREVFQDGGGALPSSESLGQLLTTGFGAWMQDEDHGGLAVILFDEPA